jgi:hypothetical protein
MHGTLLATFQRVAGGGLGLARKNHQLWLEDTRHPSLRFKLLQGKIWSIRVGDHYRALAEIEGRQVTWIWIGHHSEYDRLIR